MRRQTNWQGRSGGEIDFEWFRWLEYMRNTLGDSFSASAVLYGGQHVLLFGDRLMPVPISALWEL